MSQTQPYFPAFDALTKKDFGGSFIKGHAREKRPLSMKRPIHLVMRSTLATGALSFRAPKHLPSVRAIIERGAKTHGVKLYRYANSGNHLHLLILPTSRRAYSQFVRSVTGLIARLILSAERGRAKGTKFWDALPFTRIVEWGRDFRSVCDYVKQNTLEAIGFIPYRPRSKKSRAKSVQPPKRP